jgi:hypothetical protein
LVRKLFFRVVSSINTYFIFIFIGAAHRVAALDVKKRVDSERASFNFRTKKLSVANVDNETLTEIHKFPAPIQKLLVNEIDAVEKRIEKGKGAPGLSSLECQCLFRHRYLLPCKHVFHEHLYGVKILTPAAWRRFQLMFEENGFEVYEHRELVEVAEPVQSEHDRGVESRRLAVNEMLEQVRDRFWRIEEKGDVELAGAFIGRLGASLESVFSAQ